jgi:hypothetical protein
MRKLHAAMTKFVAFDEIDPPSRERRSQFLEAILKRQAVSNAITVDFTSLSASNVLIVCRKIPARRPPRPRPGAECQDCETSRDGNPRHNDRDVQCQGPRPDGGEDGQRDDSQKGQKKLSQICPASAAHRADMPTMDASASLLDMSEMPGERAANLGNPECALPAPWAMPCVHTVLATILESMRR